MKVNPEGCSFNSIQFNLKCKFKTNLSQDAEWTIGKSGEDKLSSGRNLERNHTHCRRLSAATAWEGGPGDGKNLFHVSFSVTKGFFVTTLYLSSHWNHVKESLHSSLFIQVIVFQG